VGQAGVDILILPVDDWAQITTYHTDLLALRAIENGVTIVRPAVQGIARIYDAYGQVLGQADYFVNDRYLLLADIPTNGTPTLFAQIGDLFAYLCVIGLSLLTGLALFNRRRTLIDVDQSFRDINPRPLET
jgi:apolipoprotein N-acyltransferase